VGGPLTIAVSQEKDAWQTLDPGDEVPRSSGGKPSFSIKKTQRTTSYAYRTVRVRMHIFDPFF
jgi:hypothetical protein